MTDRQPSETDGGGRRIRPLIHLDRVFGGLTTTLNAVGTAGIMWLMMLIVADVFGRGAFNQPVPGVPEMVRLSIVAVVFLQLASCLRADRVTHSDVFIKRLREKRPRACGVLQGLYNLVGATLFAIICYSSLPYFVKAWTTDQFIGGAQNFTVPVWPVKLIIVIGSAAMTIQFLINVVTHLRRGFRPPDADAASA